MRSLARVLALMLLVAGCGATPEGEPLGGAASEPLPTATPTEAADASEPVVAPTPTPTGVPTPTPTPTPAPDAPDDGWSPRADAPVALSEVAAASLAGGIWTAGGFTADGAVGFQVLVYDPTFDMWEEGPPLPEPRHHAALAATADRLYLIGGYTDETFEAPTAAVLVLDTATGLWEEGPPLPEPRAAGATAWDGQRVVYAGGMGPDGLAGDVWVLEGDAWRALAGLSQPREHLGAASDGAGRVWFLGGRAGGLDSNVTAVDVVEGEEVREVGDLPTARSGVAGLHLPEVGACAVGGESDTATFAEVECLDADGAVTVLPPLTRPRHGLGAAVVEGVAYAVLGGPEPGLSVSPTLEALQPGRLKPAS